ncbi:hypothetical protein GCM10009678_51260 [Actinomadura kijaniata]|uniref:Uncharacterized protein n=1 Tax=Actinomadura namibiensis TaxID=182080 RepID=A0A7W3QK64_ACTNM|nr:hypothetical protein [Actinomadura namibiensis]MBA8950095.1 hypothetical protein [Actinomadura namibiensis]
MDPELESRLREHYRRAADGIRPDPDLMRRLHDADRAAVPWWRRWAAPALAAAVTAGVIVAIAVLLWSRPGTPEPVGPLAPPVETGSPTPTSPSVPPPSPTDNVPSPPATVSPTPPPTPRSAGPSRSPAAPPRTSSTPTGPPTLGPSSPGMPTRPSPSGGPATRP